MSEKKDKTMRDILTDDGIKLLENSVVPFCQQHGIGLESLSIIAYLLNEVAKLTKDSSDVESE